MESSSALQKLVGQYELWQRENLEPKGESAISVDEVVARVASFYEKIRGIVDWREEHLLRKTAIERILKRRMFTHKISEDFAENFLSELVRGGHFPNNQISFAQVDKIQEIIEKYVFIITRSNEKRLQDWLLSIAAVEVEEALSNPRRERALIEFMTSDLDQIVEVATRRGTEEVLPADQKTWQVFVAVQRALLKLDDATITFHILERFYTDWDAPSQDTLDHVSKNLDRLHQNIQHILHHPYSEKFYHIAERFDTSYLLIGDIVSEDPERFSEFQENPQAFEEAVHRAYDKRHAKLRGKLHRAAFYSTLSVFLTKILLAVSLEIPFERYLGSELNFLALGINMLVPPLLMLVLVMSAQTTSRQNFERVTMEVIKIVNSKKRNEKTTIFPPKKRGGSAVGLVYGFYLLSFVLSFGVIAWGLEKLNFSVFSVVIFLMFVSLVLFGGTKIRQRARELMIEPEREGFLYNVFDIFSLPMIQVGRWLSGKISKYNLFVLMLNFLIEVPFQMFVEFLEQWRGFLKEKKEEIH